LDDAVDAVGQMHGLRLEQDAPFLLEIVVPSTQMATIAIPNGSAEATTRMPMNFDLIPSFNEACSSSVHGLT